MFVREFARVLEEAFRGRTLFVDLFGGSGLLSRTIKDTLPDARVIYNDFDNYADRLAHIPQTNAILADIRRMVADDPRGQKLSEATKRQVCAYLRAKERQGEFVDALTLSASLLFSGKFARDVEALCSNGMYNTVIRSDYAVADGYLDGLEVVRMDYRELHQAYMDYPGVVFVAILRTCPPTNRATTAIGASPSASMCSRCWRVALCTLPALKARSSPWPSG